MNFKMMTNTLAGMSLLVLPASAWAAGLEAAPPGGAIEIVRAINGIEKMPDIAGLETWGVPGNKMVFLRDVETGVVIAGYPFTASGAELGKEGGAAEDGLKALVDEVFAKSIPIPAEMSDAVETALSALEPAARKAAIEDLIVKLRTVSSEDEFREVSAKWLDGVEKAAPASAAQPSDDQPEAAANAKPDDAKPAPPSLLDALRASYGITIGEDDAPQMVMFADPASAECGKAIDYFASRVEAGEIALKILPVSIVSADGPALWAGLLEAEDKLAAARKMGDEGAPYARASTLPQEAVTGMAQNEALGRAAKIPRLPFFAFATKEGPVYIDGVPGPEQFEGIVAE